MVASPREASRGRPRRHIMSPMMTTTKPFLTRRLTLLATASLCCFALVASLPAAEPVPASPGTPLAVAAGSRLWLEGDSTLHAYSTTATKVEVTAELGAPLSGSAAETRAAVAAGALKALRVVVPVLGLKSGEGGLDKNLQKALKAETVPAIRFTLVDYTTAEGKEGALLIKAHGRLAIAGVEKDAVVEATCRFTPGEVEVAGAKELLMSDFGVKAPTLMLGTIKTADKVVVRFALKLKA
jgi:polyisoprenoid-binding protein YceI